MTRQRLDDKLDCKACGTIQMEIPENVTDHSPIHCSNCGAFLGEWGDIQDDFQKQIAGADSLDLDDGTITKTA